MYTRTEDSNENLLALAQFLVVWDWKKQRKHLVSWVAIYIVPQQRKSKLTYLADSSSRSAHRQDQLVWLEHCGFWSKLNEFATRCVGTWCQRLHNVVAKVRIIRQCDRVGVESFYQFLQRILGVNWKAFRLMLHIELEEVLRSIPGIWAPVKHLTSALGAYDQ